MSSSIASIYQMYLECSGVCTDTRSIEPDCLFVALKGPNFNANEFVEEALAKGAKYAIVDEQDSANHSKSHLVLDSLTALQDLARYHRHELGIPVIGITGSNGKTTTKELVTEVLGTSYRVLSTKGNLNNHIGVPLTILSIQPEIEVAVVEMGANHIGEIETLCEIARPSHGLITNIGRAHIEGFGGFEGIIRGKTELYQFLIETKGTVFINSQDEILNNMSKRFESPVLYPAKGDFLNITLSGVDPYLSFIGESNQRIQTQLIGAYNFNNVAAALCIGKFFEVPTDLAESAVAAYLPANNRSQVIKKGTNTIILDAYNANPSSMTAALNNLLSMDVPNKIAILGDMMELGKESKPAHREIVALAESGLSQVYLVGSKMRETQLEDSSVLYFSDRQQLAAYLRDHHIEDSTILIKASRSMGLEKILEVL
jgi:UDP-N-acetylmuramoyl-tripeptide--D-alanyl-D-alanine ligase